MLICGCKGITKKLFDQIYLLFFSFLFAFIIKCTACTFVVFALNILVYRFIDASYSECNCQSYNQKDDNILYEYSHSLKINGQNYTFFTYIKSARIINQFSNNQFINLFVCKDNSLPLDMQSSFLMIFHSMGYFPVLSIVMETMFQDIGNQSVIWWFLICIKLCCHMMLIAPYSDANHTLIWCKLKTNLNDIEIQDNFDDKLCLFWCKYNMYCVIV